MKIKTRKIVLYKNSSLEATFVPDGPGDFSGYRVSGFIKAKRSDNEPLVILEGRISLNKKSFDLFLPVNKSRNLPVGEFIYFIELSKGGSIQVFSNYINIEP